MHPKQAWADRPLVATLLALVCLAVWGGCDAPPPPAPPPVRPVKLFTVGDSEGGSFEYPGQIRAVQQADMAFEVSGRIVEFPVKEAQKVAKAAVLARLDPRDFEADLDKARANVAKTRTDVTRFQTLFKEGVSPKVELERYERLFQVAEAEYRQASKAVEDAVLRAPFAGVVAAKRVEDFANVQAKQPVLVLQDVTTLRISVAVPERDFARMTPGVSLEHRSARLQPRVVVSALADRAFPAHFTELTTTADPTTRTYRATLDFEPPPDASVLPGMTAKVQITVPAGAGTSTMQVPVQAVAADADGKPFVWVVDLEPMRVSRAYVEVGPLSGSWIAIRQGLVPGQTIATSGVQELREGMTVRRFGP